LGVQPTIGLDGEILEGEEAELIEIFRELNTEGKKDILSYANKILELQILRGGKVETNPIHCKDLA